LNPEPIESTVPRLALRTMEAATALGVSPEFFAKHVVPEVRCVRRGSLRLFPIVELQRWLEDQARRPLES
jgi:hypothetical protein